MNEMTILQAQTEIETALERLPEFVSQLPDVLKPLVRLSPPKRVRALVALRHARTERQVKPNSPASAWSPESGLVSISYETSKGEEAKAVGCQADTTRAGDLPQSAPSHAPAHDLVLALARAEQDPQLGFVSLKWFRDTHVPREGYSWAASSENRQRVLVDAIARNWILTGKVPNPKNPQYPVAAIRLNRALAEVRKILEQAVGFSSPFAPITIRGERLSETVLRERR